MNLDETFGKLLKEGKFHYIDKKKLDKVVKEIVKDMKTIDFRSLKKSPLIFIGTYMLTLDLAMLNYQNKEKVLILGIHRRYIESQVAKKIITTIVRKELKSSMRGKLNGK